MQRPLLLNGFMATGKSTVGRKVAELSGASFVDLDNEIEARTQMSVAAIFKERGEQAFRKLEREQLEALLSGWSRRFSAAPVVALGGGALLERSTRVEALRASVVVTLTATPQTIARRAASRSGRPLLEGDDLESQAEALLALRSGSYLEAHAIIPTDDVSLAVLADRVLKVWREDTITVAAGEATYAVEVGRGFFMQRLPGLVEGHSRALLVTDANVLPLHGQRTLAALGPLILSASCTLEPGEPHKNLAGVSQIWEAAHAHSLDRKSLVVALGGGVVTDMAGFGAATWMRGIPWVALPTTLLAMVDASVGGKTAIDYKDAKNCVGAFWQPKRVLCDTELLNTEPERGFVGALAEVVKTALIGDPELFEICRSQHAAIAARDPACIEDIVRRSVRVKAHVVSQDPRESGIRATLNLGHTLGHALEADAGYTELTHGEAVSLGLMAALYLGERLGLTPSSLTTEVREVLSALRLPTQLHAAKLRRALALLGRDKKRAGNQLRFVVAKAVGQVTSVSLELSELERLTEELASSLAGQDPAN